MSEARGGLKWQLGWAVAALLGSLAIFELTNLDLWLQDFFYDATRHRWRVDENELVGRVFFYDGPKVVIYIIAAAALIFAVGPVRWCERFQVNRRGLWLVLLVIATVPVLAGIGKKYTNVFCPAEIRRYGGDVAYAKLCEPYPADDQPEKRGGCFPPATHPEDLL